MTNLLLIFVLINISNTLFLFNNLWNIERNIYFLCISTWMQLKTSAWLPTMEPQLMLSCRAIFSGTMARSTACYTIILCCLLYIDWYIWHVTANSCIEESHKNGQFFWLFFFFWFIKFLHRICYFSGIF